MYTGTFEAIDQARCSLCYSPRPCSPKLKKAIRLCLLYNYVCLFEYSCKHKLRFIAVHLSFKQVKLLVMCIRWY